MIPNATVEAGFSFPSGDVDMLASSVTRVLEFLCGCCAAGFCFSVLTLLFRES